MFAPAWNTVLKYLALLGMVAAVVIGIWYGAHLIHADGRDVEKAIWLKKIGDDERDRADKQQKLDKIRKDEHDAQQKAAIGAIGNEKKKLAELEKRERDLLAANTGMYVTIKKLRTSAETGQAGKDNGSCLGSETGGRVRLSDEDAANIRTDYGLAQRVAIQYQTCRETLIPLVDVVPDTVSE